MKQVYIFTNYDRTIMFGVFTSLNTFITHFGNVTIVQVDTDVFDVTIHDKQKNIKGKLTIYDVV